MTAAGGIDYEKQIAERDEKIAALEAQVFAGSRILFIDADHMAMFSSFAFATIDFRGFDPFTLTDLFYTF